MDITTIGINLAKSVFQLHRINCIGKVLIKKTDQTSTHGGIFCQFEALLECNGDMRECAPLGSQIGELWAYGQMNAASGR